MRIAMPELETILVAGVLAAAALLLFKHFRKQWKGRGGCCKSGRSCTGCWSPQGKIDNVCPAETPDGDDGGQKKKHDTSHETLAEKQREP
jgi:hypothetical protein